MRRGEHSLKPRFLHYSSDVAAPSGLSAARCSTDRETEARIRSGQLGTGPIPRPGGWGEARVCPGSVPASAARFPHGTDAGNWPVKQKASPFESNR